MTGVFKTGIFWCFFKVVPAPYEGGPSMYGSLSWATLPTFESQLFDGGWPAKKGHPWRMQKINTIQWDSTKNTTYTVFFGSFGGYNVTNGYSNLWMLKLNFDQNLGPKNIFLNGNLLIRRHGSTKLPPTWFFPIDFATCKTTFSPCNRTVWLLWPTIQALELAAQIYEKISEGYLTG